MQKLSEMTTGMLLSKINNQVDLSDYDTKDLQKTVENCFWARKEINSKIPLENPGLTEQQAKTETELLKAEGLIRMELIGRGVFTDQFGLRGGKHDG